MNNSAWDVEAPSTTADLCSWWTTLGHDQQDLLRITASTIPLSRPVMDFLAWSGCPLARLADGQGPAVVTEPGRLTAFIAQV